MKRVAENSFAVDPRLAESTGADGKRTSRTVHEKVNEKFSAEAALSSRKTVVVEYAAVAV